VGRLLKPKLRGRETAAHSTMSGPGRSSDGTTLMQNRGWEGWGCDAAHAKHVSKQYRGARFGHST
jgi:hypothetical protein